MTFALRPMSNQDLEVIYGLPDSERIEQIGYRKQDWPEDMHRSNWAVDEERRAFLLCMPVTREDCSMRYVFGTSEGVALLREEGYCTFSIQYISEPMARSIHEVKRLIREAFAMAGEHIDGTTDVDNIFAVPHARFVDDPKEGV